MSTYDPVLESRLAAELSRRLAEMYPDAENVNACVYPDRHATKVYLGHPPDWYATVHFCLFSGRVRTCASALRATGQEAVEAALEQAHVSQRIALLEVAAKWRGEAAGFRSRADNLESLARQVENMAAEMTAQ